MRDENDKAIALFLDFDGTLVEFAPRPDDVHLDDDTLLLITHMQEKLCGALAVISGRTLDNLSHFMPLPTLAMAGLHGLHIKGEPPRLLPVFPPQARAEIIDFSVQHPKLTCEDKGAGMALHYRLAPDLGEACIALMHRIAEGTHGEYRVLAGKRVVELRPSMASKGLAVATFMTKPPFIHRAPVFIGDDVTDEDAFRYVNHHGGISIKVGGHHHTEAMIALPDVSQTLHFIRLLCLSSQPTVATIWESHHSLT